jgi:hypothetical protein
LPVTFIRRARSGNAGATLVFTLRLPSSVDAVCASPDAPTSIVAPMLPSTILVHMDLIDTTPPWEREKAHSREGTSMASFGRF